jgi:hypothetical protein
MDMIQVDLSLTMPLYNRTCKHSEAMELERAGTSHH